MIQQKLPPFLNVVASGIATMQVPRFGMTINKIVLRLGGTTFTKAMITSIRLKLGVRTVYEVTGSRLDAINKYKGIYDHANFLTLDFSERDAPTLLGKEIGGYDLGAIADVMTIEVTIAGATAPTLEASAWMTPSQGNGLIHKLLYIPASSAAAGKFAVPINPRGALIKRVHFFYAGTDWGASADGNLNKLEVRKNGITLWEMSCLEARFVQQEYRKVPQSKLYTYDPIVDNNASGYLVTQDAASLEFNTYLTAADTLSAYVELLDAPNNA